MNGEYDPYDAGTAPPRRSVLRWLIVPAIAFLLGLGAMGYLLSHWNAAARVIGVAPAPPPRPVSLTPPAAAPRPASQPGAAAAGDEPEQILIDPALARRVAALEQRIGQVDTQSRAAVGNADRAEGLLVAFAARRALDRGVALGFLEALLRQRFGESQPQAVGMIITAARDPVTLQELQGGLQQIGPQLIGAGPEQSWWGAFRGELGSLITVRREGTPSPIPAERLARAKRWLEAGEVAPALAEVLRMPGREHAADWVMRARRYVIARQALDAIETAALLEPRAAPQPAAGATGPRRPASAARAARPGSR
ncbi:MAG TPA: hypothetical protein VES64_01060 [Allosphingosinicella sp.]|nr:hypothetical protein [Allosphingosinicella sp.]